MTKSEKPMYEEGKELAHLLRDVLQLRIRAERLARNLDRKDHALDEAVRLLLAVVNQLADVKICD